MANFDGGHNDVKKCDVWVANVRDGGTQTISNTKSYSYLYLQSFSA